MRRAEHLKIIEDRNTGTPEPAVEPVDTEVSSIDLFARFETRVEERAQREFTQDLERIGGRLFGKPIIPARVLQDYFYRDRTIEELKGTLTLPEQYRRVENTLYECLTDLQNKIANIDLVQSFIPEIWDSVLLFEERIANLTGEAHDLPQEMDCLTQETELLTLRRLLARVEETTEVLSREIQRLCEQKFKHLVDRARADVVMFLIKHINTAGVSPEEAQTFLQSKIANLPPVYFAFWPEDRGTVADACNFMSAIRYNVANMPRLNNGAVDEAQVLNTLVHENLHAASAGFEDMSFDARIGLDNPGVFDRQGEIPGDWRNSPENQLNELRTETLAQEITQKYYQEDPPGVRPLNRRSDKEEFMSYRYLVEPFRQLKKKYGERLDELSKLLTRSMIRGGIDELKAFFAAEPDLYQDLKAICEQKMLSCGTT